jgi:general secretion pathway protein C
MKRLPVIASFVLFIAVCGSAAFWAMQLFKPPLRAVAAPPPASRPAPRLEAAVELFGGRSNIAVATNFQLKGVVASGTPGESIAILSADGKPAQAVRANAEIIPGVVVKEVHARYVLLSEGGAIKRVELPEGAKGQGGVENVPPPPGPGFPPIAPQSAPQNVQEQPQPPQQPAIPSMGVPPGMSAPNQGGPVVNPAMTPPPPSATPSR